MTIKNTLQGNTALRGDPVMHNLVQGKPKRGEKTKLRLIQATQGIIAHDNIKGVTHRSVAQAAGTQLSLVSYHFHDIDTLLAASFREFYARTVHDMDAAWETFFEYFNAFSAVELRKKQVRVEIAARLAAMLNTYITELRLKRDSDISLELIFLCESHQASHLCEYRQAYFAHQRQPLIKFCKRFNHRDPQVDAELLLSGCNKLKYSSLLMAKADFKPEEMEVKLRRQIGWVMGLKRA